MARMYAATGDAIARLDDGGAGAWTVELSLRGSGTQCLAVDPEDPQVWYVSASTGPFAAHGRGDPQARIYRRDDGHWRSLDGGLPDPIPAMPYALVAARGRLFAGLADGQI